jgi:hypothetical protein
MPPRRRGAPSGPWALGSSPMATVVREGEGEGGEAARRGRGGAAIFLLRAGAGMI